MSEFDSPLVKELAAQVDKLTQEKLALVEEIGRLKGKRAFTGTEVKILSQAPLRIVGIAISEGVWNNVVYPKEELRKAFERIKDKKLPVTVEHGRTPEFGDRKVGETEKWEWNETLGAILCVSRIDDPEAIEKLQKRELKGYSLEVLPDEAWDTYVRLAKNINFRAISLTAYPAVEFALIVRREELLSSLLNTSDSEKESMAEEKKEEKQEDVKPQEAQPEKEKTTEETVIPKTTVTGPEVADKVKELETVLKELIGKVDKLHESMAEMKSRLESKEAKPEVEEQKPEPDLEAIKKEFESKPLGEIFFGVKAGKKPSRD